MVTCSCRSKGMLAAGLVLVFGLGACDLGDEALDVSGVHPVLNFPTALGDPITLPAGGVAVAVGIAGFDLSVPDGFARATGALGRFVTQTTDCCGDAMGFDVVTSIRNSSQDERLPALEPSSGAGGDFFALFNPAFTGVADGWWDLFGQVEGLKPSTTYTIALARLAVDVRGEIDNETVLLGQPILLPDSLFLLGGAESGDETVVCNFSAGVGVTTADNPVALGTVTTDAMGDVTVDCLPVATGDSPWWRSTAAEMPAGAADSVPVGVNDLAGAVDPGQYNYILIIEGQGTAGNPVPDVNPTLRIQMGPDIDATGTVINNTFGPYPASNTDPNTVTSLPGGAAAFATPVGITLDYGNLPLLASGIYKAFLVNQTSGAATDGTGAWAMDGGIPTVTASHNSMLSGSHILAVDPVTAGVALGDFDRVVISLESDAAAASPTNPFFFFDYLDDKGTADPQDDRITQSGSLAFGTSGSGDEVLRTGMTGTGLGQIFTDSLIVSLRRLAPAAGGYSYHAFLVDDSSGVVLKELDTGIIEPDEIGNFDVRIAVDANGTLITDGSGTPDVLGLSNYNLFVLSLLPSGVAGTEQSKLFMMHISDDYRSKYSDFFFPEDE